METDLLQINTRRLAYAWERILPGFFEICVSHTRDHGPGISVFNMLTPSERQAGDDSNCIFNYITYESSVWDETMVHVPNKEEIMAAYDPNRHVIVSVHIPAIEGQNNTIGNVRLFENQLKDDLHIEVRFD